MYVERSVYSIEQIPDRFKGMFLSREITTIFRFGIEFETGNIASSFRAINKLFGLYQNNKIDAGVFVTSINKVDAATRIWPVSNRNGSFEELENRNFREQLSLPLICVGFAPDRYTYTAPFLGKNGTLYELSSMNETIRHESESYELFLGENNERIYKIDPQ